MTIILKPMKIANNVLLLLNITLTLFDKLVRFGVEDFKQWPLNLYIYTEFYQKSWYYLVGASIY